MKHFFLLLALLPLFSSAQLLTIGKGLGEYTAGNGITYRPGDTLVAARGTAYDGSFKYIQYGSVGQTLIAGNTPDLHNLEENRAGSAVVIRKIHRIHAHKGKPEVVIFIGDLGERKNIEVYIEDALSNGEIVNKGALTPNDTTLSGSVYDQLKRLKALLDNGAITQAEYDAEKKRLLGQ